MPVITVQSDLYNRVKEAARERQSSVDEILAQALRLYLWEQERHKISQESRIYHQQYAQLKMQYLGQYIAMHNGQVVDADPDFATLRQRVRQRFDQTPVMMTLVGRTADPPLARRGFLIENGTA